MTQAPASAAGLQDEFFAEIGLDPASSTTPGAGLVVVDSGDVRMYCGGCASLEHGRLNDERTSFHVASIAKQFTAFVVATLIARGRVAMEEPAGHYLDWLPESLRRCTVRQLLFHTSGIRDQWALGYFAGVRAGDPICTKDIRRWLKYQSGLNFAPGSKFLYCNSGYTLLALIVEAVLGAAFPDVARDEIFAPLAMHDTHFVADPNEIIPRRAFGYSAAGRGFVLSDPPYGVVGSTCLRTCLRDMARWLAVPIASAFFDDVRRVGYFERGTLDDGTPLRYGFGQIHTEVGGAPVLLHGGFDYGFNAAIIRSARSPVALFAVANGSFRSVESTALRLFADLTHAAPVGGPHSMAGDDVGLTSAPVGVYADASYSDVRSVYVRDDGRLWLDWMQGFELRRASGDTFVIVGTTTTMAVGADEGGRTVEFRNGPDRARLREVERESADLAPLLGRYYCAELDSVLNVEAGDPKPTLRFGRNDPVAIDVVSSRLFTWQGYWASAEQSPETGTSILVSHPRCTQVRFVRF